LLGLWVGDGVWPEWLNEAKKNITNKPEKIKEYGTFLSGQKRLYGATGLRAWMKSKFTDIQVKEIVDSLPHWKENNNTQNPGYVFTGDSYSDWDKSIYPYKDKIKTLLEEVNFKNSKSVELNNVATIVVEIFHLLTRYETVHSDKAKTKISHFLWDNVFHRDRKQVEDLINGVKQDKDKVTLRTYEDFLKNWDAFVAAVVGYKLVDSAEKKLRTFGDFQARSEDFIDRINSWSAQAQLKKQVKSRESR
jgi:hypothetical protein